MAAAELPPGSSKNDVAQLLYDKLEALGKEMVLLAVSSVACFGGADKFWLKLDISYQEARTDRLYKEDVVLLINAHRASVEGTRMPTAEEAALWAAAEQLTDVPLFQRDGQEAHS
ncbi:MAG TPA: hypothetical protein DCQ64_25360 [Candidatus Rokubacteria bacterium]|nr:hypothetical protein [Candidatus Rokubacteria bacterium]